MVVVIGLIQGLRFLGLPHNFTEARKVVNDVIAARKDVRYAYSMSQVLEHDLERFRQQTVLAGLQRIRGSAQDGPARSCGDPAR